MTVDDNEVRAGNAAGRDAAGISLPAVAWQQADGEPAEETGGAPVTGAVAPEPKAETGPEAEPEAVAPAGAVPALPSDRESGTGTDADGDGEARADAPADADAEEEPQAEVPVAVPAARAEGRPARRLSKPMIAAAATSGVVLMGVPLLLSQLGGGGGGGGQGPVPPRPSGYNQADGGPGGFVPRADAPEKGSSVPGAALPGATGAPGGRTTVAGKGPLATGVAGVGVGMGMPAAPVPTESGAPVAGKGGGGGAKPTGASGGGAPTTVPAVPRETAGTPQKPASQAPPAPPAPPAKRQYSAVAGPNCASTGSVFTYSGWYTDGKEGWQKYGSGGYSGGGCNGSFLSLPMSGKAGSDAGNSLRWTFRTGSFTTGTCQVSVHIPSNGDIKAVGGKPAYYTVHAGATGSDPILRSFNVDQPSLRGQWVSAGSVRITGGVLTVKLHDRGLDWSGSQKTYAHHAGDAARVQCTSA